MKNLQTNNNQESLIKDWNNLNDQQKAAFGDRYITHDTNLRAWCKNFEDLSELKKQRVLRDFKEEYKEGLNNLIGYGIQ
ncbi:hypothetical protein MG290_01745 [Flavobacterium sp. CBA20B-1]|uniref:hypothetical protein n=1 Tax=unclassified Flavobacterium TaxID=196869 RepID=UPI002224E102|nr:MULTISPECIES: hypothetical protein [unclassified Flavobacterium]WCM42418.1 hypothetical protein MG290_01745 [Flavobacterium sp. CBA20B-1]